MNELPDPTKPVDEPAEPTKPVIENPWAQVCPTDLDTIPFGGAIQTVRVAEWRPLAHHGEFSLEVGPGQSQIRRASHRPVFDARKPLNYSRNSDELIGELLAGKSGSNGIRPALLPRTRKEGKKD